MLWTVMQWKNSCNLFLWIIRKLAHRFLDPLIVLLGPESLKRLVDLLCSLPKWVVCKNTVETVRENLCNLPQKCCHHLRRAVCVTCWGTNWGESLTTVATMNHTSIMQIRCSRLGGRSVLSGNTLKLEFLYSQAVLD